MFIWVTFGTYQGINLDPTLQRYPNTIPMLKFSVWCGPGGENGDLINPFGSPKWCPENPCGSSQSLVG